MSMGTSLNYTSHLNAFTERKAVAANWTDEGMPYRRRYEADQGWDELFAPKRRQGATARDMAPPSPPPAERETFIYFDPSDRVVSPP